MAANNGFSLLLWIALIVIIVWFIWSCSNQKSGFAVLSPSFLDNQQDDYKCRCVPFNGPCLPWLKKVSCGDSYDITGANEYCCTSDSEGCRNHACSSVTGCLR